MNWNLGKSLFLASASLAAVQLWAAPANPTPYSLLNDGDSLTLRNVGDEHYRYTQTLDGYLVISDANGIFYYANENGEASRVKAKNANLRTSAERTFLNSLNTSKVKAAHHKKNPDRLQRPASANREKRAPWVPTAESSVSASSSESDHPLLRLPSAEAHATGTNRFPVLLVEGSGSSNADSTKYWNRLNQTGYSLNNHLGSVKDYFAAQSNNLFVPTFDVYLVTVSGALSSYTDAVHNLLEEAITNLKSKYPNFDASLYDSDGDGEIDATAFLYAGTESAANNLGGYQYELQWNGGRVDAGNGKKFNSFFLISQMSNSTTLLPIATFVHEFSHTMGLKDHYCVYSSGCYNDYTDSAYQAPGVHGWDVMATGMYNNGGGKPVGYSAFEKEFMGWMSYTTLTSSSGITVVNPLNSANMAYKVPVSGDADEWYVIENRQATGWDASLPNHGLLVWHIDYDWTAWNNDALNDDPSHQRVDVVEAGSIRVNDYYSGFTMSNLADDIFPGSQSVTSFTAMNSWAGTNLGVNLYNILEEDGDVCFATQSGVAVTTCVVESSSSSAESSSAAESSSSSAESSSSVESSSSSELTTIVADLSKATHSMQIAGNTLQVSTSLSGRKALALYDVLGNVLYRTSFDGSSKTLDLQNMSKNGVILVKLTQNGRLLSLKRMTVR